MQTYALQRVAPQLLESGIALEMVSMPGCGKTENVHQIGANESVRRGKPYAIVTMILTTINPEDIRGYPLPVKSEEEYLMRFTRPAVAPTKWNVDVYVDGKLDRNWSGGVPEHGMIFLDEFAQADNDVKKPSAQLILDKRIGEYRLPPGWVVWMASNRLEDYSGVIKPLAFINNRRMLINIDPAYEPWELWAMRNNIHPVGISFAKRHADLVFNGETPNDGTQFLTPRSLVLCIKTLVAMSDPKIYGEMRLAGSGQGPDDEAAAEFVLGWLGAGAGTVFLSFLKLAHDLPEIADIIRHPKTTRVPENAPARYVLVMSLAHHVTTKTCGAILTYISRPEMDKELQILFAASVTRRDTSVLMVPEFTLWAQENADLALIANG